MMADRGWVRVAYLAEALAFAAFVAIYIWKWQAERPQTWWVMLAWLLLSALARRDTLKTLGWRADNLLAATRRAANRTACTCVGAAIS